MNKNPWKNSFIALGDALSRLKEALEIEPDPDRIVMDATIQRFEFTFELFWKTLKRLLLLEGIEARSPRETFMKAYQIKWLDNEKLWLDMLRDRNLTSHIYDDDQAKKIYLKIKEYYSALQSVYAAISEKTY